jgi:hypothetical protein
MERIVVPPPKLGRTMSLGVGPLPGATDIAGQRAVLPAWRIQKRTGDCPLGRASVLGDGVSGSDAPASQSKTLIIGRPQLEPFSGFLNNPGVDHWSITHEVALTIRTGCNKRLSLTKLFQTYHSLPLATKTPARVNGCKKKRKEKKMSIVKKEDIKGYRVDQEIVCDDCISAEELDDVLESDILFQNDADDDLVFCDRCKSRL